MPRYTRIHKHIRGMSALTDFIRPWEEIPDIVKLWLLRLLVPLGGHREFVEHEGFRDDNLARLLGMSKWVDGEECAFDKRSVQAFLRRMHNEYERALRDAAAPEGLVHNISKLSELVGLSETDRRILEFAVLIHSDQVLDDTAEWLGQVSSGKVPQILSVLLQIPEHDIRMSLSARGILAGSGLVTLSMDGMGTLRNKLDLLSPDFADAILYSDADPITLLRNIVLPSKPTTLDLGDFDHIEKFHKVLLPYLHHALATHRSGVNILMYGVPGTGKSELSRLMAKMLKCELFEVAGEDGDGDPVSGDRRLRAFSAGQSFFANRRALILFDEVEDVFDRGNFAFGYKGSIPTRKAWINRMLEGNRIPALWVSNSVDCIDQAYIRRFDMVIELPIPPRRQRERIVRNACADMLSEASVQRIAETSNLSPAVITRAVSVVHCIRGELDNEDVSKTVEQLIENTLKAQGHRPIRRIERLPNTYDPAYINADANLEVVAKGLARTKSGRLFLSGPPGTGKTAFGRWLAEKLEAPLCVRLASDLLSMYVGGTEHNLAAAFREAEQEGAALLIDEVDSFLQDRRRAKRSWEVTGVNEMLTQMERFAGVFIATTNLMNGIDQAAFRRFDLNVRFDFLTPAQAWRLLASHCKHLGVSKPKPHLKSKLARLSVLTPGDFSTVARQHRFRPIGTPSAFIDALEQCCLVKEESLRETIGFI